MRTKEELIPAAERMKQLNGPMTFAKFVRGWRGLIDLSQIEAAAKLGVTKSTLSDIEAGRRLVSVELAREIAKKLRAPETQAIECCLEDQLRKARVARWHVKLVA